MWKLINKPITSKATKKVVNEFVKMEPAPHDRPISEKRLKIYQKLMNSGLFRPITWAKVFCKETDETYRVNGKHTSLLLSRMEILPEIYITVEEYECDTLEDVARLYSTFDSKTQSRSVFDINSSFASTISEFSGISMKVISLAVSGMSYHIRGVTSYQDSPAERAERMIEHSDFVLWFNEILSGGLREEIAKNTSHHLRRYSVAAAMFGSWSKSKNEATKFWKAVRDETGPSPLLVDRKLAKFLITSGVDRKNGPCEARKAGVREFYIKCWKGWRGWNSGNNTDLKYYPDCPFPTEW